PNWLVKRASRALEDKKKDARFDLCLTEEGGMRHEILLLDLRLFRPGDSAEQVFLRELAKHARRFVDDQSAGITEAELKDVVDWADGRASQPEAQEKITSDRVTLLPRFLAEVDFSLPIVLFS